MRLRERFFRWILAHRLLVVAAGGLVAGASAWVGARIPIDYGMEQFFPSEGSERSVYDEYRALFSKEDAQFALFWEDDRALGLGVFLDLERSAHAMREAGLEDVRWFGNVELTETVELDGEETTRIYRLVDEPALSDSVVRAEVARRGGDDLFDGVFWNPERTVFTVYGYLAPQDNTDARRREIEEAVTGSVVALQPVGAEVILTGIPVLRSRIPRMLERDQALFVGGGFLVFCVVLLYFFRHPWHVALCLASVVPGYLGALALLGLTGRSVSILTSFIPIVVMVVGVSDAIHILDRYRSARAAREDSDDAVVETFLELSGACLYTSLTTALGFATLAGTRIGIVVDFGLFTALAIMLTYGCSMTLLPALLGYSSRMTFSDHGLRPRWMLALLSWASAVPRRSSGVALAVFAAAGVAGLLAGATLRVNTFMLDDMEEDSEFVQELRRVEALGFGLFQVNVFLRSDESLPLHSPEMLSWMQELERAFRADPLVVDVLGPPDVFGQLRQAVLGVESRELPSSDEEAAQLLLVASMDAENDIDDVYLLDGHAAQIVLTVRDEGSASMLPLLGRLEAYLAETPPPSGSAAVTGTVQMAQTYATRLVRTFGPSLALAIGLVFAVMAYMFRSARLGLLALLPNIFPLLVLMGAMKVLAIDLKPSTILVFSIAFGLAVDDTLHFVSDMRKRMAAGVDSLTAVHESVQAVGPAILMTSVAMAAGFALLMGSQFQVLVLVGVMTAVSVIAAVFADLFALPSMMHFGRRLSRRTSSSGQRGLS
jgi:hypothetical protein